MQISNVLSSLTDAAKTGGKKAENAVESLVKNLKPGATNASTPETSRAEMAQIMRQYDVTSITPEDFSKMIQKMRDAGLLTDQDVQELSTIRTELENQGVGSNETVNLVQFYSDRLKKLQQQLSDTPDAAEQNQLAPTSRKLDWLQKFALLHANPEAAGIDVAA